MSIKNHVIRHENVKAMQQLHAAGLNSRVIAMFMTCEGIDMQPNDVNAILKSHEDLGAKKVSSKKVQALIDAKHSSQEDESLPCPASY